MNRVMNSFQTIFVAHSFHGKPGRFVVCPDNHVSFRGVRAEQNELWSSLMNLSNMSIWINLMEYPRFTHFSS